MGDCCVEPLRNELEGLNQAVTEKEEEANRMGTRKMSYKGKSPIN